jgi:preprotein translocase subunit SecE
VSRSTNASKGTPDDDEGRLDDAADESVEADDVDEADAADDAVDDETDEKVAAASGSDRAVAKKREGSRSTPAAAPTGARRPAKQQERRGPIAAIVLFVRQVISELRKVVTPTSKELVTYSAVVIVFVLIVMAYVGVLDFAVGRLVLWAFGG